MAGRHPQPGPCSPLTAQGAERQQRGLRGPRASPPELEDPRVSGGGHLLGTRGWHGVQRRGGHGKCCVLSPPGAAFPGTSAPGRWGHCGTRGLWGCLPLRGVSRLARARLLEAGSSPAPRGLPSILLGPACHRLWEPLEYL